jgi:hypothetical protein
MIGMAYTGAVALAGASAMGLLLLGPMAPKLGDVTPVTLFQAFFWGSVLSTWLGGIVGRSFQ